jgi:hypothetical protein
MAIDSDARASRRNVLVAALGGLGGLLAGRLGSPDATRAADGDPALLGTANTSTHPTTFENTTNSLADYSLRGLHVDGKGVLASVDDEGTGLFAQATGYGGHAVVATSLDSAGVLAVSTMTNPQHPGNENAGVIGIAGDNGGVSHDVSETGVYGFCDTSPTYAAGVWGDTIQGIGVVGTGDWGVFGSGNVAIKAVGAIALHTTGKVVFYGRSGHNYVRAGHYYVDIPIGGMTAAADVLATLRTRKSGYYINAVVPYTGKFRLFLNKTTYSNLWFNFLVLNG